MRVLTLTIATIALAAASATAAEPDLLHDVLPVLKARCVKCHGPAKQEGGLNLSTPGFVVRGGESGAVIAAGNAAGSLLWQRIEADEMPPDEPLPANEKMLIQTWIAAKAPGLPASTGDERTGGHWSFQPLAEPALPTVEHSERAPTAIDRFLLAALAARGVSFNPEADRATLIRRVSFDLTGLPPTPDEIETFEQDRSADAYRRMVERYLASPRYGQRWGKFWLDAAGYADSNGYFNADTDRPLAYRYRDYVVRSIASDKAFDRFIVEQLAGDELANFTPETDATPAQIELLEATHFLRNGQDGSGESDGNPDEVRIDRYSALEASMQIVGSSLLGLSLQCAKCHDHKFEPVSQRDYYNLQAVFFPAFNVDDWVKPNDRVVYANLPGEMAAWQKHTDEIDHQLKSLRNEFVAWVRANRPPSQELFRDAFDKGGPPLADHWSATAPGDDTPGGTPPVELDGNAAPAARAENGTLAIVENGASGDRWLSTKQSFDWTPDEPGQWIQATFDLVNDKVGDGPAAARIGYFIALVDFDDGGDVPGGNILIDGNPEGGASVHVDYPGGDAAIKGTLGESKYEPGHNYGVRITRKDNGRFSLVHLCDGVPDDRAVELEAEELPDGGFGFEYCCNRSFTVDNVVVERSAASANAAEDKQRREQLNAKQHELAAAIKAKESERRPRPGKIAWTSDRSAQAPEVFLLERGDPRHKGEKVRPAALTVLAEGEPALAVQPTASSSGRRLAWARWLVEPGSPQAGLVARVQVNRVWQQHFGAGLVATTENLGVSGSAPSHLELLEYLAARFVAEGWSLKQLHRAILNSAAYRQTSAMDEQAFAVDPDNRLLWRRSLKRLDAEAMRDAMLAVSGQLDETAGGPYVPTRRDELGEVVVADDAAGAKRRSLYLQQRRTQMLSLLNVFDSPSIVFNCLQRPVSTIPLQSLSLLNSPFALAQAEGFAKRLQAETGNEAARIERAYRLVFGRPPRDDETQAASNFVNEQQSAYGDAKDASEQAWRDFCQMLLASSSFLYLE